MDDTDRIVGQLQAGFDGLNRRLDEVARAQESARAESRESRRNLHERIDSALDRLAKLEPLQDTVESHAGALSELEERMEHQEVSAKLALERQKTNSRWIKAIGAGAAVVGGDHISGSKIAKWFMSLFGG